ncbi:MAG TPA: prepilin-type N-terminal cleavage/methylation domain-containing protein [Candidatus Acidoferrales bacterium]
MKSGKGFSLIELMVSMAILVTVVGLAITALVQAEHVTQSVAYEANTQESLRAGMRFMVQDLAQAGEGIPEGGISVPNTGGGAPASTIIRPGMAAGVTFPNPAPILPNFPGGFLTLPAVVPGAGIGQPGKSVNPVTRAVLIGNNTDVVNILYADNILVDSSAAQNHLYSYPVYQPTGPSQTCNAGAAAPGNSVLSPTGLFVKLDPACFLMPGATNPISVGNLIMFHNQNGTALEYVTSVAGSQINFAAGDPAGLNATGKAAGTVASLQNGGGGFPPTTITRVWLISYYIDSTTDPLHPQLMRQVNYPNYPAANPVNPPQAIADNIEALSFSYDITGSLAPGGTYPAGAGNAPGPVAPDGPNQIRAANIFLAGRSEAFDQSTTSASPQFLRNNLSTQVSIRSLAFLNTFGTSLTSTSP